MVYFLHLFRWIQVLLAFPATTVDQVRSCSQLCTRKPYLKFAEYINDLITGPPGEAGVAGPPGPPGEVGPVGELR